jgi:fatty acid desaturase
MLLNNSYHSVPLLLLSILVIAGLQVHLAILMHEGAHLLLHPRPAINNILNDYFCAFPIFNLSKIYRTFHLNHHRYSGATSRDPEVEMYKATGFNYQPQALRPLLFMLLKDLSGFHALTFVYHFNRAYMQLTKEGRATPIRLTEIVGYVGFWALVLLGVHHWDMWREFIFLWILPLFTFSGFFIRVHGYGEHTGVKGHTEYERTFIHNFNPLTNFFYYPIRSGYHLEHHLFPAIPWYRMDSFRTHLVTDPEFRSRSVPVQLDGVFWGKKTIWNQMLYAAEGSSRDCGVETRELIGADTDAEIAQQFDKGK